jgi:hypothetical protein
MTKLRNVRMWILLALLSVFAVGSSGCFFVGPDHGHDHDHWHDDHWDHR